MKKSARLLIVMLALTSALAVVAVAVLPATPVDAQITPLDDEPDDAPGLGSIIGSPDAGPKPEDAGDRGGYAQLGLALLIPVALLFIGWRVVREARSNQRQAADGAQAGEAVVKQSTTHNQREKQ